MMLLTREMAARVASSIVYMKTKMSNMYIEAAQYSEAYVVFIRVDGFRVEALFAFLLARFDVLANPDVAVQAEDEIDAAG